MPTIDETEPWRLPPYTLVSRLLIPAIDLDSPVVGIPAGETSVPEDMVGWVWGPPGVGFNCTLAGHRDKGSAVFRRLDEQGAAVRSVWESTLRGLIGTYPPFEEAWGPIRELVVRLCPP